MFLINYTIASLNRQRAREINWLVGYLLSLNFTARQIFMKAYKHVLISALIVYKTKTKLSYSK